VPYFWIFLSISSSVNYRIRRSIDSIDHCVDETIQSEIADSMMDVSVDEYLNEMIGFCTQ